MRPELLSEAKFPVILNGGGVVMGGAIPASKALAERLDAPVCCGYQHNDAFPGTHPLFAGPLGYNGSKAAMELIAKADVVLALGTRLNPFSTLPGYGIDYWPKDATIIQVDINPDRIGLTKKVAVGIVGDAKKVAEGILARTVATAGDAGRKARKDLIAKPNPLGAAASRPWITKKTIPAPPGTSGRGKREPEWMSPRMAWRAIQCRPAARARSSPPTSATTAPSAMPIRPSRRAGNIWRPGCSGPAAMVSRRSSAQRSRAQMCRWSALPAMAPSASAVNEMTAIGREEWPAITMIVFRNYQWGAEKRNSTLWYHDNFVGTELDQRSPMPASPRPAGWRCHGAHHG